MRLKRCSSRLKTPLAEDLTFKVDKIGEAEIIREGKKIKKKGLEGKAYYCMSTYKFILSWTFRHGGLYVRNCIVSQLENK